MAVAEEWRPGSFTKNFSWGPTGSGLRQLHEMIQAGFADELDKVPRRIFRERVARLNRPDFIAINFFLLNRIIDGEDYIIFDELAFRAKSFEYDEDFDKLALFCFNLSYVGNWKKSKSFQKEPALWARHYILDKVQFKHDWKTDKISADDIEEFIANDPRYTGKTSRKLATNLNYLYNIANISEMQNPHVSQWWTSALFLCLDRAIEKRKIEHRSISEANFDLYLRKENFIGLSGGYSTEKDLAIKHLVALYTACGARDRFSNKSVRGRQMELLPELANFPNDPTPIGVMHPTNFRIQKTIPRACAMLAHSVGFEHFEIEELAEFDSESYIRERTKAAFAKLKDLGIKPTMSLENLLKLTRGK